MSDVKTDLDPVQRNASLSTEPDRAAFAAAFDGTTSKVGPWELILGLMVLFLWFGLFAGGVLIGTGKHIEELSAGVDWWRHVWNLVIVFLFWTITNVGILSCIAALLGALGRRTRFASRLPNTGDLLAHQATDDVVMLYASALIRGFGVYALVLAGLLVLATDQLVHPDQGGYVRLAGLISVISFYAGYDPEMFAGFLERVKRFLESK